MSRGYELTTGDFEGFFAAPFHAYGAQSKYVPMMKADMRRWLDNAANPLFVAHGEREFFVLRRNGEPIGRIVAHVHHDSNRVHHLQRGCFGFFDCADDAEAAQRLLTAAEQWCAARKLREIAGNFNLTAMQQIGVVTEGFEHQPYMDQVYSPPHIAAHLRANGYEPFFPMQTFEIDIAEAVARAPCESAPDWRIERITRSHLDASMEAARRVLNDGFAANPMFVALSREEFAFQAKDMMWILDPRISSLAWQGDDPAGVVVCIPDLNPLIKATGAQWRWSTPWHYLRFRSRRRRAVIIYYAVSKAMQGRGLMKTLLSTTLRNLQSAGYETVGVTWIADVNGASLRQMQRLGARSLHRTHLFGKSLA